MGKQTAVRRGKWKLVLNGQLVEGAPPEDEMHLSDLETDVSEAVNLKDRCPEVAAELKAAAEKWRAGIEARWKTTWLPHLNGTTTHQSVQGA
jgi:arylsulfatase A-like enzyme